MMNNKIYFVIYLKYMNDTVAMIIFLVILLVLVLLIYYVYYIPYFMENFFCSSCKPTDKVHYREAVYVPKKNGVYEKKLAIALLDTCINTTLSHCENLWALTISNPPTFHDKINIIDSNQMYGSIFWSDQYAIFVFSGTITYYQLISDLDYPPVEATELNGYEAGIMCHRGFYKIYIKIRKFLWDWYNINKSSIKNLFITGFSLGAALSTICAYDFIDHEPDLIHYSFASPRCGNIKFTDHFNRRVPQSLRINNTEDIIPQFPLSSQYDYKHTNNNLPFTVSFGNFTDNHIKAYIDHLPE